MKKRKLHQITGFKEYSKAEEDVFIRERKPYRETKYDKLKPLK